MVSTPEGCADNIPMKPNQSEPTKKPLSKKSLHQFKEALDIKRKTSICRLGVAKAKHKAI